MAPLDGLGASGEPEHARLKVTLAPGTTPAEVQEIIDALDTIHFEMCGEHVRDVRAVIDGQEVTLSQTEAPGESERNT